MSEYSLDKGLKQCQTWTWTRYICACLEVVLLAGPEKAALVHLVWQISQSLRPSVAQVWADGNEANAASSKTRGNLRNKDRRPRVNLMHVLGTFMLTAGRWLYIHCFMAQISANYSHSDQATPHSPYRVHMFVAPRCQPDRYILVLVY